MSWKAFVFSLLSLGGLIAFIEPTATDPVGHTTGHAYIQPATYQPASSYQVGDVKNLIPNGGFEQYQNCPRFLGNLANDLVAWESPTLGSTDYFNRCSEHMGTPENFNGEQPPSDGEGYAGFYAYAPGDYREYLQARLREPLEQGRKYRLRAHISLSERSDFGLNSLGFLFTQTRLKIATKKNLPRRTWHASAETQPHYIGLRSAIFFTDTENWTVVDTVFIATGKERFLTIGNFESNARTRTFRTGRRSNKGAYYYLDGIRLESVGAGTFQGPDSREPTALGAGNPASLATGDTRFPLDSLMVMPSLLFQFNAYQLTPIGERALTDLYRFLETDPALHLELRGHTDSVGRPGYNLELSEQRCVSVASHLGRLGLDSARVRWTGYGASRPVAANSSPDGRRQNRRVEFMIRRDGQGRN